MTERFAASRVERVRILEFEAPPALVFPLHGFREEKAWAVGWEPQPVYPADGTPGDGAVFLIRRQGVEEIWVLTRWDPEARIVSYVHVTPGRDVTDLRIRVTGPEDGPSRVEVAYAWTGLSDEGNAYVARQTEEDFRQWMGEWEEEMRHYLRTGRKLERPQASG